jgi:hypothetical protein
LEKDSASLENDSSSLEISSGSLEKDSPRLENLFPGLGILSPLPVRIVPSHCTSGTFKSSTLVKAARPDYFKQGDETELGRV